MLPAKLKDIKDMLTSRKICSFTGEEELLRELHEIDKLLEQIKQSGNTREAQATCERLNMMISAECAITAGPADCCPCCGRKN